MDQPPFSSWLETLLHTPLLTLCPPERLALLVHEAALLYLPSAARQTHTQRLWAHLLQQCTGDATLRSVVPPSLVSLVRTLLSRPFVPHKPTVVALLNRPKVQRLFRELTLAMLTDFGRKLRAGVDEANKTRGGVLGRLASEAVKKGSSAFSALAPTMTQALSTEVDRQVKARLTELTDLQVEELTVKMAQLLTDPARQNERCELVLDLVDFVLELKLSWLCAELSRLDVLALSDEVAHGLGAWLGQPEARAELTRWFCGLETLWKDETLATLCGPAFLPVRAFLLESLATPQPI